jgi:hypothetical protein
MSSRLAGLSLVFLMVLAGCDNNNARFGNDVCDGHQHVLIDATKAACDASERGEWLEGRCYCHGTSTPQP